MPDIEEEHGLEEAGEPPIAGTVTIDPATITAGNDASILAKDTTLKRPLIKEKTSQDLSSAALSYEDVASNKKKFHSVTIHFSSQVNQTVEVFIIDPDTNYTTKIASEALESAEDVVLAPSTGEEYIIDGTDKFKITCTNNTSPAVIAYLTLRLEDLG